MNFNDALRAHRNWKQRLRGYIEGESSAYLDPLQVGCEEGCDLGKWIRARHGALKQLPEFIKLRETHAAFHRCAAQVIAAANSGDTTAARMALEGEYARLSAMVVKAITRFHRIVGDTENGSAVA